jgi:hypothetical protein
VLHELATHPLFLQIYVLIEPLYGPLTLASEIKRKGMGGNKDNGKGIFGAFFLFAFLRSIHYCTD